MTILSYFILFTLVGFFIGLMISNGTDESLTVAGLVGIVISIVWAIVYAGFGYGVLTFFEIGLGIRIAHFIKYKN